MAPVGCELIIRGVTPADGLTAAEIVRKAVDARPNDGLELYEIEILSSASSNFVDRSSTFCYARLAPSVLNADPDGNPRPDLLNDWIEPLKALHSGWEVGWSPTEDWKGQETLVGVTASSSWSMDRGAVTIVLTSQQDVETLIRASPFLLPPHKDTITACQPYKQIEPIYAFELVITKACVVRISVKGY
ncbi:hypothetical protein B0H14DRAFT_2581433 [Mycena olivaceomarginata]|nr:hypothetical protein B0H14DRAFT_2581433 [Mycena olivaceomarginata]